MHLLCWPVLTPQMIGLALFPAELNENESDTQSPMALPLRINSQ